MMSSKNNHANIGDIWRDTVTGENIRILNVRDKEKMNGDLKKKHNRFKFVMKANHSGSEQ